MITIQKILDEYYKLNGNAKSVDKALFIILEKHKKTLQQILSDCDGPTQFHKIFRQADVIDCTTDMVIWHLLHASDLFWIIYEQLEKDKNDQIHNNS